LLITKWGKGYLWDLMPQGGLLLCRLGMAWIVIIIIVMLLCLVDIFQHLWQHYRLIILLKGCGIWRWRCWWWSSK